MDGHAYYRPPHTYICTSIVLTYMLPTYRYRHFVRLYILTYSGLKKLGRLDQYELTG